jgi:RHS repeat-associated protein
VPLNAWGTPHSAIGNPWLFTGRELDEEAALYFYRGRYYSPALGRFTTRDPKDYAGGTDLYEYARGNPTKFTDPQGMLSIQMIDEWFWKDGAQCGEEHFIKWNFRNSSAPEKLHQKKV